MGLSAKRRDGTFTYADYLAWPEGERWELIDGVAFNLVPAPSDAHQGLVVNVVAQLRVYLKGKPCKVRCAPYDVRLPVGDEDDADVETVVQPDIVVVCDATNLDERGCRGAPDFIIEVLSKSTTHRDLFEKTDLYERVGVKEYWILHPTERVLYIQRLDDAGTFMPVQVVKGEGCIAVEALPGVVIDLDDAFSD